MEYTKEIAWLKNRLQQPLPGIAAQELMKGRVLSMPTAIPDTARLSAVLCLLYYMQGKLHIFLMQRTPDKGAHSGQISFPGGRKEDTDDTLQSTALREAYEEVGIIPSQVDVLGALTPLYIPVSNFLVHPFVGFAYSRPAYNPNSSEVANTLEIPLKTLLAAERKAVVDVTSPAVPEIIQKVNAYRLEDNTIIWGATAMIISELEVMLSGIDN